MQVILTIRGMLNRSSHKIATLYTFNRRSYTNNFDLKINTRSIINNKIYLQNFESVQIIKYIFDEKLNL